MAAKGLMTNTYRRTELHLHKKSPLQAAGFLIQIQKLD